MPLVPWRLGRALLDMMTSFPAFVKKLHLQILPNDVETCEGFDGPTLGTPMCTSMLLPLELMRPLGPQASRNGTLCLVISWPD